MFWISSLLSCRYLKFNLGLNVSKWVKLRNQLKFKSTLISGGEKAGGSVEFEVGLEEEGWVKEGQLRLDQLRGKYQVEPYPAFQFQTLKSNLEASPKLSTGFDTDTLNRTVVESRGQAEELNSGFIGFNDISRLVEVCGGLEKGQRLKSVHLTVAGRILSRREASSKLIFYDLQVAHQKLQLVANQLHYLDTQPTFTEAHHPLRRGDIIRVRGFVGKSNSGEPSLFVQSGPELLCPCLSPLPLQLESQELLLRRRVLTLLLHQPTYQAIKIRAKVLRSLRRYLDDRGFIEVETPILATQAGGAAARSFSTSCRALDDLPLHLRIAPELYLKQMVVGGFDKVYEIGRVFRNESIDPTHNPEFTTCEFYLAYSNLDTLFELTEELLRVVVQEATGSLQIPSPATSKTKVDSKPAVIDFAAPFKRINVVTELVRLLGEPLPDFSGSVESYLDLCQRHGIKLTPPYTIPRILDQLVGDLIEPQCHDPTFLVGHPTIMTPLARGNPDNSASRFELFINGLEFINAYEELNIPHEQLARFVDQASHQHANQIDPEAHPVDTEFCQQLSYGLPPTAGWGLGIDRLVGLLSGASNLRTVISFPLTKPRDLLNTPSDPQPS